MDWLSWQQKTYRFWIYKLNEPWLKTQNTFCDDDDDDDDDDDMMMGME